MITIPIEHSATLDVAQRRFLDEINAWIDVCLERYGNAPPTDVHDQGTYMTGWEPAIRATGNTQALAFMIRQRDAIVEHFTSNGMWHHGYWRRQEAHHGTEHFELFLGALSRLTPTDAETYRQLLDATEHIGNWVVTIPPWFDWGNGVFRSMFLGTEIVGGSGTELNVADHLRFVNLCLLAHTLGGGRHYLDFARGYGGLWADAILASPSLPVGILAGEAVYALGGEAERTYRGFAGMAGRLGDDVDRAENILASGGLNAFLRLWQLTGEQRFRSAAEQVLNVVATQLGDPDAGPAADIVRVYRRATGDGRYDRAVLEAGTMLRPTAIDSIGMEPEVHRPVRPQGIGKRADAPIWYEDGHPRRHNPILLAVTAEITQDPDLALCALDLARTTFTLARRSLSDGREHGCAANTVSAVARGHGRDNHAGMVTAVLAPLMEAFAGDGL